MSIHLAKTTSGVGEIQMKALHTMESAEFKIIFDIIMSVEYSISTSGSATSSRYRVQNYNFQDQMKDGRRIKITERCSTKQPIILKQK